ncbi:MAG: peptidase S41, partial [Acidobacteriota bacterium]
MQARFVTFFLAVAIAVSAFPAAPLPPQPSMYDPALSPDGSQIAFVSGGDIWTVAASGGQARLLVSHPATESRPLYSPDGKSLAFVSTRTGNGDIYVMSLTTGQLARVTWDDGFNQLDNWSADGKWLYFSSNTADISGMNDIYRVSAGGGTPMAVSADRYVNEYFSAPSPDGSTLAFSGHGIGSSQWWRHGHSHIDESEIWLLTMNGTPKYRKLTAGGAKELWPMWSADGSQLFYMSDGDGSENIRTTTLDGKSSQITHFKSGRLLWPSISADGRRIVFERDFGIGILDTTSGTARTVPITLLGAPATPEEAYRKYSRDFDELALAPDGKKVAIIVHGEVFAGSAKDGGEAARVTSTPEREYHVRWSPDSRKLVYGSSRGDAAHLYLYDFTSGREKQITNGNGADLRPQFSPDGKSIAFVRDGHELRVVDLASNNDSLVATADIDDPRPFESTRPFVWSPDSRWIAFMNNGARLFRNASVVNVAGGPSTVVPVSFLGNIANDTLAWSPDGSALFFDTGQRTEPDSVARVWLVPHTPSFRETQFRDLFHEETLKSLPPADKSAPEKSETKAPAVAPEKSKPVEIVAENIRKRLDLLPIDLDVQYVTVSPDGKLLLMIA